MATMNVSLPDPMKHWVVRAPRAATPMQAISCGTSSGGTRPVPRPSSRMQGLVDEDLDSGEGTRSMAEIKAEARRRAGLTGA